MKSSLERRRKTTERVRRWRAKLPPEHRVWDCMKRRCTEPNHISYSNYGGSGIGVCARWLEKGTGFKNFLADMGPRPSPKHHLHRKNVMLDYEKDNCEWVERSEHWRMHHGITD